MSKTIACDVIAELGTLHFGRKKVQPSAQKVREFREEARQVLKYPLLSFSESECATIADGLADAIREQNYTCYACAVMPDHVHILIRKHCDKAERMLACFQESSRLRLCNSGVRSPDHPVWGGPGWKVFLDTPDSVRRTIRYIVKNPRKWRLPLQDWVFVKRYDGWPFHHEHSLNSPQLRSCRTRPQ
jgi:REP element-mobilizing transposase RayT